MLKPPTLKRKRISANVAFASVVLLTDPDLVFLTYWNVGWGKRFRWKEFKCWIWTRWIPVAPLWSTYAIPCSDRQCWPHPSVPVPPTLTSFLWLCNLCCCITGRSLLCCLRGALPLFNSVFFLSFSKVLHVPSRPADILVPFYRFLPIVNCLMTKCRYCNSH